MSEMLDKENGWVPKGKERLVGKRGALKWKHNKNELERSAPTHMKSHNENGQKREH